GGLAELLAGEGMDDADLKTEVAEGIADDVVIAASSLDDDDAVQDLMGGAGPSDLVGVVPQRGLVVFEPGGSDEHVAVEVGEHPLRPRLGGVDGDDSEMLGTDL